jgi:hypothetical protein
MKTASSRPTHSSPFSSLPLLGRSVWRERVKGGDLGPGLRRWANVPRPGPRCKENPCLETRRQPVDATTTPRIVARVWLAIISSWNASPSASRRGSAATPLPWRRRHAAGRHTPLQPLSARLLGRAESFRRSQQLVITRNRRPTQATRIRPHDRSSTRSHWPTSRPRCRVGLFANQRHEAPRGGLLGERGAAWAGVTIRSARAPLPARRPALAARPGGSRRPGAPAPGPST